MHATRFSSTTLTACCPCHRWRSLACLCHQSD